MWEAYGLENEDFLWAGANFLGGLSRHQEAVCGTLSAAAIALGLRYRTPLDNLDKVKAAEDHARDLTAKLVDDFTEAQGNIICTELLDHVNLSDPEERKQFKESPQWEEKCVSFVKYVVGRLYEMEAEEGG